MLISMAERKKADPEGRKKTADPDSGAETADSNRKMGS
jgi:hypothetical protein